MAGVKLLQIDLVIAFLGVIGYLLQLSRALKLENK